ncbi:hypothetical protein MesoLj113a_66200 [Mesorhizobium sp. 113-1-2]|nr:hypothetical protein MesoLj113a_66200 [Mesorhizobium sp. 113-1-2]
MIQQGNKNHQNGATDRDEEKQRVNEIEKANKNRPERDVEKKKQSSRGDEISKQR